MKKITESDYDNIMVEVIKEDILKAVEEGHEGIALPIMLMGVRIGNNIKEKLFDTDNELEIVSNEET